MRVLIRGARIIDGTGAPSTEGDLLIEDERIGDAAGPLSPDLVIDGTGLCAAPGFIDMHSHGDFSLPRDPLAGAKVLQGITTEVVGNCGLGLLPANDAVDAMLRRFMPLIFGEKGGESSPDLAHYRSRLETPGVTVNVASLIPHGNVRCAAMGMAERAPTASELGHMRDLVDRGMTQGAFGLSTGLVYAPGIHARTDELVDLARAVRPHGGFYASHIRDEAGKLVPSIAEAIAVGEQAGVGVQISHHKAIGYFNWGKVKTTLGMVDAARARGVDVHSDVYPYTAGSTILAAILVSPWVFDGAFEDVVPRLRDPASRKRLADECDARLMAMSSLPSFMKAAVMPIIHGILKRSMSVSSVQRQHHFEGRTLGQVARMRKQPFYDAMYDLLAEEEVAVAVIAHVMWEKDVRRVLCHAHTMIGTDGIPIQGGKAHPRTYGSFPRVLGHYVRDQKLLSLEEGVHRMTGLTAQKLGMKHRGTIRPGNYADLVLFDAARIDDMSTYDDPNQPPAGIHHVLINGQFAVKDGKHTGQRPGKVLSKQAEAG